MTQQEPDEDDEVECAHVIRDGRVIITLLIEPIDTEDGKQWLVRRESRSVGIVSTETKSQARFLADQYLSGFVTGSNADLEIGEEDGRRVRAKHRSSQPERAASRIVGRHRRIASCEGIG